MILMNHRRLGNMRFLLCVNIVFHTLENQLPHKALIKAWSFAVKIKMFWFYLIFS